MSDKKELKLGTRVRWTSSAAGSTTTKQGVIVGIVPSKGFHCDVGDGVPIKTWDDRAWSAWLADKHASFCLGYGRPQLRAHVSYLVRVPGKTEKHKAKIYQPRVRALEVIE